MPDVRITCITKSAPQGGHEHITHVGNPAGDWKWSVADVVASIDAKNNTFYVKDELTGKRADVGVVRPNGRAAYLRTHADSQWNDNLLAQPSCG